MQIKSNLPLSLIFLFRGICKHFLFGSPFFLKCFLTRQFLEFSFIVVLFQAGMLTFLNFCPVFYILLSVISQYYSCTCVLPHYTVIYEDVIFTSLHWLLLFYTIYNDNTKHNNNNGMRHETTWLDRKIDQTFHQNGWKVPHQSHFPLSFCFIYFSAPYSSFYFTVMVRVTVLIINTREIKQGSTVAATATATTTTNTFVQLTPLVRREEKGYRTIINKWGIKFMPRWQGLPDAATTTTTTTTLHKHRPGYRMQQQQHTRAATGLPYENNNTDKLVLRQQQQHQQQQHQTHTSNITIRIDYRTQYKIEWKHNPNFVECFDDLIQDLN